MILVETHAHLDMVQFDEDRSAAVGRAVRAGVRRIITVGIDRSSSEAAIGLAHRYPAVYAAVGIHPHDAKGATDHDLDAIEGLARDPKVVAIGEIGLDFYKNYSPREDQERAFEAQIEIAARNGLPVIIHDRDAHERVIEILSRHPCQPGVFHCFSGDAALAGRVMDQGFYISFTGNITFNKADRLREALKASRLDRLMLETDCPFMAPEPHRGKRAEPAHVEIVARRAAEILAVDLYELAAVTTNNAYDLFGFERRGKALRIAYELDGALYLNITNRCGNRCLWCARQSSYVIGPYLLRLDREPTIEEIIAELERRGDGLLSYSEVVFCGFGEPLMRIDDLIKAADWLRGRGVKRIRVNTNGWAGLALGRDVVAPLVGRIDAVSVSLNAPDSEGYQALCNPGCGIEAHSSVVDFVKRAKALLPEVVVTAVDYPGADLPGIERLAISLGVPLSVRSYAERP